MPSGSKRRKTTHQHHQDPGRSKRWRQRREEFSQSEIWDDSALVRSWEDAVREYEYYHSLAARGIDPEEVLDEAEEAERVGVDVDLRLNGESGVNRRSVFVNGTGEGADGIEDGNVERGEVEEDEVEDGEIDEEGVGGREGQGLVNDVSAKSRVHGKEHGPPLPPDSGEEQLQPQPVTANATEGATYAAANADQALENLKMAYYWAGYYSGLYDGQRQAAGVGGDGGVDNSNRGKLG